MKLKILPSQFALMDYREKACIIAFIEHYIQEKLQFEQDLQ